MSLALNLVLAATLAIVNTDAVPLRAAARDSAPQQALLWQGEALEVRGERLGFVQVYDHRRERGGFVRAAQLRTISLAEDAAPELRATLRFLRDVPGMESQGIGYAAAYLKAAPAEAIDAEVFDAIGTMAERLARRASATRGKPDAALAAHLDVAASYGVTMTSFERSTAAGSRMLLCYDGDAFTRVLALPGARADPTQRTRAALALTRHECIDPALPASARQDLDARRAELLDSIDLAPLPEPLRNRVRIRRAGVLASVAFHAARRGEAAQTIGAQALQDLAAVNKNELADDEATAYSDAAVRAGASRWAAVAPAPLKSTLSIVTRAGEPGQTCVQLVDLRIDARIDTRNKAPNVMAERCTWGVVWAASARANAGNTALALAVQPLAAWRELWLFHRSAQGWRVDVLPPAMDDLDVGYLEFAGWVQEPGAPRVLAVREARINGRWQRSYELIRLDTLQVEKRADAPQSIRAFSRWQSAEWKRTTVSLR
jgi:hypothetical protein